MLFAYNSNLILFKKKKKDLFSVGHTIVSNNALRFITQS